MEKLILLFLENINLIFAVILVFGFIIPIIFNVIRTKKIKSDGEVITEKTILVESQLSLNIFLKIYLLLFVLVGLIIIYVGTTFTDIMFNKIISIIFGSIFVIIPLVILGNLSIRCKRILNGDYVIIEDILKDKEQIVNHNLDTDSASNEDWFYLFFENYFKKYNKRILVNFRVFNNAEIGDKFYLVFTKSDYVVFNAKDYTLEKRDKVISVDELGNYINIKIYSFENQNNKQENDGKKVITKEQIKKDFNKVGHRSAAISEVSISIGLLALLCLSIFVFKSTIAIIILSITTCIWVFLTFVKVKYVCSIYKNINKGNYNIKEDEIISLNNQLQFKDSNTVISFKLKNYKKIVYSDKQDFVDVKIGDKLYLVFVKGESEPIKVYNAKYSTIQEN